MKDLFFTRGQFAKLCNTTKETLRHYDNIGLLKPDKVGDNGYNYYSARQFSEFTLISTLKSTGCSLEKIIEYVSKPEQADFKKLLTEQLNELMIEKRNIQKREQILKNSIKRFDVLKDCNKLNTFFIREEKEEYFIATKVGINADNIQWNNAINEHFKFCHEHNISFEYQFSYIINWIENVENHIYYVASKIPHKIKSDRLYIKPAGRYIKMIYIGRYEPEIIYKKAYEYAKEAGVEIKKKAYESEISIYMGEENENYMTEFSIEVQ